MKTQRHSGGYLLLEAVLALSIFVVAVVGLIQTLNAVLDADYAQRRQTIMRLTLQNLLATGLVNPHSTETYTSEPDRFGIRYRRLFEPSEVTLRDGTVLSGLRRLTVRALDSNRDDQVIRELSTYVP